MSLGRIGPSASFLFIYFFSNFPIKIVFQSRLFEWYDHGSFKVAAHFLPLGWVRLVWVQDFWIPENILVELG